MSTLLAYLPVYFGLQILSCLPKTILHLPRIIFQGDIGHNWDQCHREMELDPMQGLWTACCA